MPEILGTQEGDGWVCMQCKPPYYCGRIVDLLRHAEVWHQLRQWTVDAGAGVVYEGLVEMAAGGE